MVILGSTSKVGKVGQVNKSPARPHNRKSSDYLFVRGSIHSATRSTQSKQRGGRRDEAYLVVPLVAT